MLLAANSNLEIILDIFFKKINKIKNKKISKLLVGNNQVLQDITYGGQILIPMGILATTFSGEMSSLIGSSRVLKALADDDIFGPLLNFVKYGKTKSGNPWVAVLITFIIAEVSFYYK